MEEYMKVSGSTIKDMEKEHSAGLMGDAMMETSTRTRRKGLARSSFLMAENTLVNGRKTNKMGKDLCI